jgi:hypothetical protein
MLFSLCRGSRKAMKHGLDRKICSWYKDKISSTAVLEA